ncbi:MAG TPA: squalene synthase HpnC [Sphingomonadales bacterium]|nr:squalene synthase HpnC [Sphingomonadales bacterium]
MAVKGKAAAAETPSGKGAGDENFPVGSFLLPARLRPHVACYYAFARAIDDIADNPILSPKEKTRRLENFARAVKGKETNPAYAKAIALKESLAETGVDPKHALDLVSAFKQDAVKLRYRNWGELMDYCDRSAAPVGRYLLELHGENRAGFPYSDALCNALQVINHLQDCKGDFASLNRVYLPQDWLKKHKGRSEDLKGGAATPGLLAAIRQCVAASRKLMETARKLPARLQSRQLAMESAVIVRIAEQLLDKLGREDPVAKRVELNALEFISCGAAGAFRTLFRRGG